MNSDWIDNPFDMPSANEEPDESRPDLMGPSVPKDPCTHKFADGVTACDIGSREELYCLLCGWEWDYPGDIVGHPLGACPFSDNEPPNTEKA